MGVGLKVPSLQQGTTGMDAFPFLQIDLPGGWRDESIQIGTHSLTVRVAAEPDRILERMLEGAVLPTAFQDPYWAKLWPSAISLARFLAQHQGFSSARHSKRCLELGCGSGLPGLTLLELGHAVTFSDYIPEAVALASWNAQQNGWPEAESMVLDWNAPASDCTYDVLVGSDLIYDAQNHLPLLTTIDQLLRPDGRCFLADPGRGATGKFLDQSLSRGFWIDCFDDQHQLAKAPGLNDFRVFELSRAE